MAAGQLAPPVMMPRLATRGCALSQVCSLEEHRRCPYSTVLSSTQGTQMACTQPSFKQGGLLLHRSRQH